MLDETEEFIKDIICGYIIYEVDEIIEEIRARFYGLVQKTLIVALKDVYNRYLMIYNEGK